MSVALQSGSPQFPSAASAIAPSTSADIDAAVVTLRAQKDAWVAVSPATRATLLARLTRDFYAMTPRWVAASLEAKGVAPDSPAASEEWVAGPYPVLRNLRQLHASLSQIAASGYPKIPGPVVTLSNGQVAARVFPYDGYDRIFYSGVTADIWMEHGVSRPSLYETQAVAYHQPHTGKVALVLGAGNVSSIGPMDLLYKLFVEDQVVLFKCNPVNAYLGPLMEEAFRALVDGGYLRIVYGGVEEGAYACQHPGVDEIHITGSDKTFDAIVFGSGEEGARRKAANQPVLEKRVTGELGNVSPVIVVPGPWSDADLKYQAEHLVTMLANNAGFNCNATRVVLQHASWSKRLDLLRRVRDVLGSVPARNAYYPGAHQRHAAFVASHPEAEQYGEANGDILPWTFIPSLDVSHADDIAFTTEAFCGLFAEAPIEAATVPEYIDRAVAFANETLWGSLNVTLLVHPASMKDPAVRAAVERAVNDLRYGTVAINYWAAISYAVGSAIWGAYPGHPLNDIQSGNTFVHNTLMFARPQKTVVRAPFRATPTPPLFTTRGATGLKIFPKLCALEANPSPLKVPGILRAALGG